MKLNSLFLILMLAVGTPFAAHAQTVQNNSNMMDELDPFDPNIQQKLREMDREYESETGKSPFAQNIGPETHCVRQSCAVWAQVVKSRQKMYLYVNGKLDGSWDVSTGVSGRDTPNFDTHPDGRIYDRYTSSKYPGGDYNGLGNMPYAVFISGGFALHGTAQSNWPRLGHPASHGCIRMLPDNAYRFNRLVRQVGINNTWITVQD